MRGDIGVRLNDGQTDRHITRHVSGLRFRKTAPGGHADGSCTVDLPLAEFPDLGPTDRLYFYDARNGRCLLDGYTNNPGATSGRDGQSFDLAALGGQSRLADNAQGLIYIDQESGRWNRRAPGVPQSARTDWTVRPDSDPAVDGMLLGFTPGQPVDTFNNAQMGYQFNDVGMYFGAWTGTVVGGTTDGGWQLWLAWDEGAGWNATWTLDPGPHTIFNVAGDGIFGNFHQEVSLQLIRIGAATNVSSDRIWEHISDLKVLGQRVDKDGTPAIGWSRMFTADYVRADWVVADLMGRLLRFWCDPATCVIEETAYEIDQLAFGDGVNPAQVLDALLQFEGDMLWEVLESGPGGHRFNYRAWPTTPRYVIPASIPVERPGGDFDLCNRVKVTWADADGNKQVTIVETQVEALITAGRLRDADPVTLPAGRGSAANAQRLGEQILASKSRPPRSGTCVVDRPIMDLDTGAMVMPWELEPGYLALDSATGDSLRVTEMEYDDPSCSTTLTLGEPQMTNDQRIARLEKVVA